MNLLILGAGFTGEALLRALAAGHSPLTYERVTATHTAPGATTGPGASATGVDQAVWRAPDPLPCPAEHIVVAFPPRGVDPQAAAERVAGARRLVYVSATSVYGACGGAEVTEHTPPNPGHPSAFARLEAEDAMRARGAVVVRAGGIYGPGRNVIERLRVGQLRNAGDPQRPVNLIHVDDLATIVLACLDRAEPGEVVLAATGRPLCWQDLANVASQRTGLPIPAPSPVPSNPDLASFYTESKRVRPTRLASLGVELRYPDAVEALRHMSLAPS